MKSFRYRKNQMSRNMLATYKAILRNNRSEWSGPHPALEKPVTVYVTILDEPELPIRASQGDQMAAVLERTPAMHTFKKIQGPAGWERDIRRDRQLPDRS